MLFRESKSATERKSDAPYKIPKSNMPTGGKLVRGLYVVVLGVEMYLPQDSWCRDIPFLLRFDCEKYPRYDEACPSDDLWEPLD